MSRMPSTSTGTMSVIPASSAARSTSMRNGLGSGGRTSGSCANAASDTGSRGRSTSWPTRPMRSSSSRRLHLEATIVDRFGDDGLRELAVDQLGEEPFRRTLVHAQPHAGCALAQVGDQRGHEPATRGADHAEARVPGVETLEQRDVGAHRFELPLHPTRTVEHQQTEFGGLCTAPAAHEQRHPELGLELAHLVGHVRLHRRQCVGGGGERPFLGDGEQRLEVSELHGGLS